MLSKMEFYGISDEANKLIQPYFNNTYQRVLLKYNSMKYSFKWEPAKQWGPQGSIHVTICFSCTLMIFQKLYQIYPKQLYLQMIHA